MERLGALLKEPERGRKGGGSLTSASELLIKEFQKLDSIVLGCEGGHNLAVINSGNPTAVLVIQILSAVAQFDNTSSVLKLRTARKVLKAKNGKCEGRKRYGEIDPKERKAVP